jgi:hypothetical protein
MTKKKPVHNSEVVEIERPVASESQLLIARLASQGETQPAPLKDEVQIFLKAKKRFSVDAIGRKETPLKWWKANSMTYPALSRMARAYLGASGSSCSVKRLFLAAANVCTSNWGRLLPSTMSRCVSNLMWL